MIVPIKVSPKYQVTIPVEVREKFGIKAGDELSWYDAGGSLTLIRTLSFAELRGYLSKYPYQPFARDKHDHDEELGLG